MNKTKIIGFALFTLALGISSLLFSVAISLLKVPETLGFLERWIGAVVMYASFKLVELALELTRG